MPEILIVFLRLRNMPFLITLTVQPSKISTISSRSTLPMPVAIHTSTSEQSPGDFRRVQSRLSFEKDEKKTDLKKPQLVHSTASSAERYAIICRGPQRSRSSRKSTGKLKISMSDFTHQQTERRIIRNLDKEDYEKTLDELTLIPCFRSSYFFKWLPCHPEWLFHIGWTITLLLLGVGSFVIGTTVDKVRHYKIAFFSAGLIILTCMAVYISFTLANVKKFKEYKLTIITIWFIITVAAFLTLMFLFIKGIIPLTMILICGLPIFTLLSFLGDEIYIFIARRRLALLHYCGRLDSAYPELSYE